MSHSYSPEIIAAEYPSRRLHALMRSSVIGLTAFLTVVDLFAIQAILPTLAQHYKVTAAAMGFAVNASTTGMANRGASRRRREREDRAADGDSYQPCAAVAPDRTSRQRPQFGRVHAPARLARRLHVCRLRADARLSRRRLQHGTIRHVE